MNPTDFTILDLIPQRPPMAMIDSLIYADEKTAKGTLAIKESNLFCEQGILAESGLIEFIAQTAAAYTGLKSKTSNLDVAEGYIGAIKNLVIYELPRVNTAIESPSQVRCPRSAGSTVNADSTEARSIGWLK